MTELRELYYLTDLETERRNPQPEMMFEKEVARRNEFLERQSSRSRWVKAAPDAKGWSYG